MRLSASFLLLGAVTLLIRFVDCQELTSTLQTSDIYRMPVAYDGENVIFTCVTRGSGTIAWSSEEQIGSGGRRLELVSVQPIGTSVTAGTTTATLISVSDTSGSVVIVSQLRISVSSNYQTSSVTCHSVGTDTQNTTLFYMADEVSLQCDNYCPGETVTCTCTVASSTTLSWISDEYFGRGSGLQFTFKHGVPTTLNTTVPGANARLTRISDMNGVFVITSEITLLSTSNYVVLTCCKIGLTISRTAILSINDDCAFPPATSVTYLMTTFDSINNTDPSTGTTIPDLSMSMAGAVVGGVIAIAATVIVITLAVIFLILHIYIRIRRNRQRGIGQHYQMKFKRNVRQRPEISTHSVSDQESAKDMYYKDIYTLDDNCVIIKRRPVASYAKVVPEEESPKDNYGESSDIVTEEESPEKKLEQQLKADLVVPKQESPKEIYFEKNCTCDDNNCDIIMEQQSVTLHTKVVAEEESPKEMYFEKNCTCDDNNCDIMEQQSVTLHTKVVAEEESPKNNYGESSDIVTEEESPETIQDMMSHTQPLRPFVNRMPIQDGCHVTPFRNFSHRSEVSPSKEATQQFSRDQDLMVFPLQEESQQLSKEQETMVSPLEEATQPFSNEQEITIRDLQTENKRLRETVRCLQTENERLREKESVSETVVQEKYNKLNMVDDVIGVMETDITLTNYKAKEAQLMVQEKSNKIDILDDEVGQLMVDMLNVKPQYAQDGAGAMVCNVIKLKSTRDGDDIKDYKTFKKDKK